MLSVQGRSASRGAAKLSFIFASLSGHLVSVTPERPLAGTARDGYSQGRSHFKGSSPPLPTLLRFLFVLAILGGLVAAGMYALATLVRPEPRETTVTIPNSRLPPR